MTDLQLKPLERKRVEQLWPWICLVQWTSEICEMLQRQLVDVFGHFDGGKNADPLRTCFLSLSEVSHSCQIIVSLVNFGGWKSRLMLPHHDLICV